MLVLSLCILLVLIGVWGWLYYTSIDMTTSYYWESLEGMSEKISADDWDSVKADMTSYFDRWNRTRDLWIYFLNQKDLDAVDASIKRLTAYVSNMDKSMSQAEIEELRVKFNIIKESESLSLENIF